MMVTLESTQMDFSALQRIFLALYCFVIATGGLIGNGTVIYSTLRYNAIKIDEISLIFVQNLAIGDMLTTLAMVFPQFVTWVTGEWVLGEIYCFISAQLNFVLGKLTSY